MNNLPKRFLLQYAPGAPLGILFDSKYKSSVKNYAKGFQLPAAIVRGDIATAAVTSKGTWNYWNHDDSGPATVWEEM